MIVVADTSVILNLCRVQHERLLQQLFKRVLIPSQVAAEFARLSSMSPRFAGIALPDWIEVLPVSQKLTPEIVQANLDPGESAAIALCLDQKADALLIDESLAREVAARLGLRTIGVLGLLIEACRRNFISDVKTSLDQLEKEAGFWITPELRKRVLDSVNEK